MESITSVPAIELKQVSYAYESNNPILTDINLTISQGSWVSIVGPNGCGKSTLARLIGGLLPATEGEIALHGVAWSKDTRTQLRRRIGMVFQNPDNQFVGATVEEDLAFGLEGLSLPRNEMISRIQQYSEKLDIAHILSKHPGELSGGQKQRVAIASCLAMEPDIIILDEASSMLDERARGELLAVVRGMRDLSSYTLISITHDAEEILASDRALVLGGGRLCADLSPAELFANPPLLSASRLLPPYRIRLQHSLQLAGIDSEMIHDTALKETLWPLHSTE